MKKIADVLPLTEGLFYNMDYDFKFIEKEQLDILFLASYSQRTCSNLVELTLTETPISTSQLADLSNLVLKLHKNKWDKNLHVYEVVYEPIYNYYDELSETITLESTDTSDSNVSIADGGTIDRTSGNTRTDNLQESVNNSGTEKVFGFNSVDAVDSDTSIGSSNTSKTGTVTDAGTNKETRNLVKDTISSGSNSTDSERIRTSTHKGNIGNITSQHLLKEEIELWKWNAIHEILSDVKDLLTIPMYI